MSTNAQSIANRNQVYHTTPERHRFSMRAQILEYLRTHGPATREEVAIALGKAVYQISGRFTALLQAGLVEETNERRPTRTGHQAVVVRLRQTDAELGRALVQRGEYQPPGMVASMQVCAYLAQQRTHVETYGQCETGCQVTQLIAHPTTGRTVCPRTLQACPSRRLAALVAAYERINTHHASGTN